MILKPFKHWDIFTGVLALLLMLWLMTQAWKTMQEMFVLRQRYKQCVCPAEVLEEKKP